MIFVFVGHAVKKIFLSLLVFMKLGSNQVMLLVSKKKKEKKNQVKLFSENCAYIYLIMELVFVAVDSGFIYN